MVARDAVVEGRILDLCASTDIVNDEMMRSVPAPRVADADGITRSGAYDHIATCAALARGVPRCAGLTDVGS
jgi:hypothetical protein